MKKLLFSIGICLLLVGVFASLNVISKNVAAGEKEPKVLNNSINLAAGEKEPSVLSVSGYSVRL